MDPVSRNRTTPRVDTGIDSASASVASLSTPQSAPQSSPQVRPGAGAAPRVGARPESLPQAGRSRRTRLIFKERFKERLSEVEGPSAAHYRAQDLSLYRALIDDAIFIDAPQAPRLKKALLALHRLHGAGQPALSLPAFVQALLRETQSAEPQLPAWQQIPPGLTPANAFLLLVMGTQQLTASNCSADDAAAIKDSLQFIKSRVDPHQAADIASHVNLGYLITLIAKNAGPLVSRLFFDAEVIPLDRHPTRFCPNTKMLTNIAIDHASPAFARELALTNIKQDNPLSIEFLRKMLATPNCGVDVIRKFVAAGYDLIGLRFAGHSTALHVAAQYSDPAVVAYLLSLRGRRRAKLDIHAKDALGEDALCLTAGNLEHGAAIASLLIERGAKVEYDDTTYPQPILYMLMEKNAAGLKAILDGVSRRQRERLIGGPISPGGMPLILYAAQHGSADILNVILDTDPTQARPLKLHFRHLFEVAINEVTNGGVPIEAVQEVLDNIPPGILRELDQNFSFYGQAVTLPASQAVLNCLVEYNERRVRAGGEPVFATAATIDRCSRLLSLVMSKLDQRTREAMLTDLSKELLAPTTTAGATAGVSGGFRSQLSSVGQIIAETRALAEANDPEYFAGLDEAFSQLGLSMAPVVPSPPPRGPESPGPNAG